MTVEYLYGSPPDPPYDYKCFVRHLAPHLPGDDKVFFHNGSLRWRANRDQIPLDLFRNICHWKSSRPFGRVCVNEAGEVNEQWHSALRLLVRPPFEADAIKQALAALIVLHGVRERTASALLTAWDPREFAIMDERVFTVLDMQDDHKNYTAEDYVEYLERLRELRIGLPELGGCALRQIELALWHYYAVKEAGSRKRSGNV